MQTLTSQDIDYIGVSFKLWCAASDKPAPTAEHAFAYFSYVQEQEPYIAELIDGDWDDFLAFLRERRLLAE